MIEVKRADIAAGDSNGVDVYALAGSNIKPCVGAE